METHERFDAPDLARWLILIQAEYREMPGLHLTRRQMQRLWSLDAHVLDALVNVLVEARILKETSAGGYVTIPSSAPLLDFL